MPPVSPTPAVAQLNIALGGDYLLAILDVFGVAGWNRWVQAMAMGYMPLGWSDRNNPPPVWYWLDAEGLDLSGRDLDGIDLGLMWCRGARFDLSSLVGGRLGCCEDATFRGCDLRDCEFIGDISAVDFRTARLERIRLDRTPYDPRRPPLGLSDELLGVCDPQPDDEPPGDGLPERPVEVKASITTITVTE
jgi:hypothetical protein